MKRLEAVKQSKDMSRCTRCSSDESWCADHHGDHGVQIESFASPWGVLGGG